MAKAWWKEAVIYQVYPSSFQDSNGDGWGDLKGIISRLDYLKELGVDIVWVSPIYKSPQKDMGYDIADYKAIDPIYGSIEDIDVLISELKKRGMKLMMDLVVNHTSDEVQDKYFNTCRLPRSHFRLVGFANRRQHAWFQESRSSLTSPKRDWYIWKKPRQDAAGNPLPPNNWSQILGEANSAWTYDTKTDEYFLSLFTPEQPDLNWENPEVREAVHDVMSFWLERGTCGYRMDVINLISKDQSFPDAEPVLGPEHKHHPGSKYYVNGPRMHEYLQEIKQKVLEKYGAITVGEMPGVSNIDEIIRTVGTKSGELNMIFIFDVVDIDNVPGKVRMTLRDWSVKDLAGAITKWQQAMIEQDGWNSVFVENHDNPRSVSRYCDDSDEYREYGAKLLALMQTTLSGTLFVYQGEELGMRNVPKSWDVTEEYKDIESINFWKKSKALYAKDTKRLSEERKVLEKKARDHARTPMQWDASANAGFCKDGVVPWMRANDDFSVINTEKQIAENNPEELSTWQFWQRGLASRKEHADVFVYGDFQAMEMGSDDIFAYLRTGKKSGRWLIVLNFSGKDVKWEIPEQVQVQGWMAGNYLKGKPKKALSGSVDLKPWEGILGKCED